MPIIRDILCGAANRGADLERLCRELKIQPKDLFDSGRRVDFETAIRSWELAVKQTKDPQLGLHLGESANPTILGLIGHLMQSAPTTGEAFRKVCEYAALATDMFVYSMKNERDGVVLEFTPHRLWQRSSAETAGQASDQAMSGTLNVFRLLTGRRIAPYRAMINRKRPLQWREYERALGCEVRFSTKINALWFRPIQMDEPVASYDQSLFAAFDGMLTDRKKNQERNVSITDQVTSVVHEKFGGLVPSLAVLAGAMNLSGRTLQRKLKDEGKDYRSFSAGIKRHMAETLLKGDRTRVKEVASILGYADATSFRRAMKAWNS